MVNSWIADFSNCYVWSKKPTGDDLA
jgi:hypothetical protein